MFSSQQQLQRSRIRYVEFPAAEDIVYLKLAELMKRLHDSSIRIGISYAYIHISYPYMVKTAAVSTIHDASLESF